MATTTQRPLSWHFPTGVDANEAPYQENFETWQPQRLIREILAPSMLTPPINPCGSKMKAYASSFSIDVERFFAAP
jgi:hypothetical protein